MTPQSAEITMISTAVVTPAAASGTVPRGEIMAVSTTPISKAAARPTIRGTDRRMRGQNSARVDAGESIVELVMVYPGRGMPRRNSHVAKQCFE